MFIPVSLCQVSVSIRGKVNLHVHQKCIIYLTFRKKSLLAHDDFSALSCMKRVTSQFMALSRKQCAYMYTIIYCILKNIVCYNIIIHFHFKTILCFNYIIIYFIFKKMVCYISLNYCIFKNIVCNNIITYCLLKNIVCYIYIFLKNVLYTSLFISVFRMQCAKASFIALKYCR